MASTTFDDGSAIELGGEWQGRKRRPSPGLTEKQRSRADRQALKGVRPLGDAVRRGDLRKRTEGK